MKTVYLAACDAADNVTGRVTGSFDDDQLQRLRGYLGHVARLNETALLARGRELRGQQELRGQFFTL